MARFFLIPALLAFASLQVVAIVHEVEHGCEHHDHHAHHDHHTPHEHDGVPCHIVCLTDRAEDDLVTPPQYFIRYPLHFQQQYMAFTALTLIVPTIAMTPPGRAPPFA